MEHASGWKIKQLSNRIVCHILTQFLCYVSHAIPFCAINSLFYINTFNMIQGGNILVTGFMLNILAK